MSTATGIRTHHRAIEIPALAGHPVDLEELQRLEQYRAVLEGDTQTGSFGDKVHEVQRTREIVETGSAFRGKERRAAGLGPQSVSHAEPTPAKRADGDEGQLPELPAAAPAPAEPPQPSGEPGAEATDDDNG